MYSTDTREAPWPPSGWTSARLLDRRGTLKSVPEIFQSSTGIRTPDPWTEVIQCLTAELSPPIDRCLLASVDYFCTVCRSRWKKFCAVSQFSFCLPWAFYLFCWCLALFYLVIERGPDPYHLQHQSSTLESPAAYLALTMSFINCT